MIEHDKLIKSVPYAVDSVELDGYGEKVTGKVRDMYQREGQRILITTDRVSAFDRVLGYIPYKGQVLNQLSVWWFERTQDIIRNHLIASPDEMVTVAVEADPLPVEVVVRGYITGVTSTSMWTLYESGDRAPYGIDLPDGLQKNDQLATPVITPTTKAADVGHDERITRDEIIAKGLVSANLWQQIERVALDLFERGQDLAEQAGLILVDTKYEFGLIDDELALIDEIHTPDSSRYWIKESYGLERDPEHYDKEFLRQWLALTGFKGDGDPPAIPAEVAALVSARYLRTYELLTGEVFAPAPLPASERIQIRVDAHFNARR